MVNRNFGLCLAHPVRKEVRESHGLHPVSHYYNPIATQFWSCTEGQRGTPPHTCIALLPGKAYQRGPALFPRQCTEVRQSKHRERERERERRREHVCVCVHGPKASFLPVEPS